MTGIAEVNQAFSGRYRVKSCLGTNSNATVFLVDDLTLNRSVVLKVFNEQLISDETFVERFAITAEVAATLRHPHLVATYDWGLDPFCYFVTEYLEGGSLQAILEAKGVLSQSQVLVVALEAARALSYAHSKGLTHFGVKPSNMLFDLEGRLHLTDFGLAVFLNEAGLVNAFRYSVPEKSHEDLPLSAFDALIASSMSSSSSASSVFHKKNTTTAFDVYCLALVVCEAITGGVKKDIPETDATPDADLFVSHAGISASFRPVFGPLWYALDRTTDPAPGNRPTAGEVTKELLSAAEMLPRPKPLPLVGVTTAGHVTDVKSLVEESDKKSSTSTEQKPQTQFRPTPVKTASTLFGRCFTALRDMHNQSFLFSAMLILLICGSIGFWVWNSVNDNSLKVPDLLGMNREEALTALSEFDWNVEEVFVRSAGTVTGEIVDMEPEVRKRLAFEETLVLFVSLGEPLISVPDLYAFSIDDAENIVEDAGLELADPANLVYVHDDQVPKDFTVGLDLQPGVHQLEVGAEVSLLVSAGPADRIVPDVPFDRSPEISKQVLLDAGFAFLEVDEFSMDVPVGLVKGFDPSSGTLAQPGTLVEVIVSSGGSRVEVPLGLLGREVQNVVAQLEIVGFEVEVRGYGETVISVDPEPGASYPYGSRIVISTEEA
ncbi:MAG: PASTA domain-containing protein [Acidimicrobiaceae bacterium]|nr:PASTA domain-containing protein [Acidimicrobiaceae bacterium]